MREEAKIGEQRSRRRTSRLPPHPRWKDLDNLHTNARGRFPRVPPHSAVADDLGEASWKKHEFELIGLGFGSEFIPIYQAHPKADVAASASGRRGDWMKSAIGSASPHATPSTRRCSPIRTSISSTSTSPIPDHARMSHRGPEGRQARDVYRADGDDRRGVRADRRTGRRRPASST